MTPQHATTAPMLGTAHPLAVLILLAVAAAAVILAATWIFGVNVPGPSLEFAPDPAGIALPF